MTGVFYFAILLSMKSKTTTQSKNITIFTDGSSLGNPGKGGYAAVLAIQSETNTFIHEIGGRADMTTNNRMELTAVIQALTLVHQKYSDSLDTVTIHSDSSYVLNGITSWVTNWERNNWRTSTKEPVQNEDLWRDLVSISGLVKNIAKIVWKKVAGHSGVVGNERCDVIATTLAEGQAMKLYVGDSLVYQEIVGGDIFDIKTKHAKKTSGSKKSSKPAYAYLSYINGKVFRDATWTDCEKRVKGVKGVKYQKVMSKQEEQDVTGRWALESLL